jgi:hypothetical protein
MFYFDRTGRAYKGALLAVLTPCLHWTLLVRVNVGCANGGLRTEETEPAPIDHRRSMPVSLPGID